MIRRYTYTAGWSTSATRHEVKEHSLEIFVRHLAESRGTTIEMLALAATLARPWADVVLTGAATIGQVQSSVAALEFPYDAELEEQVRSASISSVEYWRARTSFRWN